MITPSTSAASGFQFNCAPYPLIASPVGGPAGEVLSACSDCVALNHGALASQPSPSAPHITTPSPYLRATPSCVFQYPPLSHVLISMYFIDINGKTGLSKTLAS